MTKGDVIDLSRGKSKILWQIELRWNISKVETHAFYWASDVATAPGEAARVITCVEAVGVQAIKRLLKSRKIAFTAGEKKEALALRLHEYIDAAKAPPGSDNENAGPPKAEKTVSFDDGQPPAKKPKKLPPLEVD